MAVKLDGSEDDKLQTGVVEETNGCPNFCASLSLDMVGPDAATINPSLGKATDVGRRGQQLKDLLPLSCMISCPGMVSQKLRVALPSHFCCLCQFIILCPHPSLFFLMGA